LAGSQRELKIILSPTQVKSVITQVSNRWVGATVLSGLPDQSKLEQLYETSRNKGGLSSSFLAGLVVLAALAALPADEDTIGVTDLARQVNADAATTHRYVQTLLRVGLAEQDPETRRYYLPRALRKHTVAKERK